MFQLAFISLEMKSTHLQCVGKVNQHDPVLGISSACNVQACSGDMIDLPSLDEVDTYGKSVDR